LPKANQCHNQLLDPLVHNHNALHTTQISAQSSTHKRKQAKNGKQIHCDIGFWFSFFLELLLLSSYEPLFCFCFNQAPMVAMKERFDLLTWVASNYCIMQSFPEEACF
jgi:hypothetical protein